jgi:hypothetical protein
MAPRRREIGEPSFVAFAHAPPNSARRRRATSTFLLFFAAVNPSIEGERAQPAPQIVESAAAAAIAGDHRFILGRREYLGC